MATRKPTKKTAKAAAKKTTSRSSTRAQGASRFTPEERAAMRDRARELKAASRKGATGASDEEAVLARIAAMPESDRVIGERLHALVRSVAPTLAPRLWYGMPAYAQEGTVLCFFQDAAKFKARYATLGFSGEATLDDGSMWPTAFALARWNADVESRVAALLATAVR